MIRQAIGAFIYLVAICTPAVAQMTPDPAHASGTPDIPGLNIVWLTPWGRPALAREWRNIIVHQSEGPAGSARRMALKQMEKPDRRGATIWVETDGTVYWSVVEFAAPGHLKSNRNDNKYVDNSTTFQQINNADSIGVEFVGNYPNVRRPVTQAQADAWLILAKVLQTQVRHSGREHLRPRMGRLQRSQVLRRMHACDPRQGCLGNSRSLGCWQRAPEAAVQITSAGRIAPEPINGPLLAQTDHANRRCHSSPKVFSVPM